MSKVIILIGKTGSGKSTLANVISDTTKFKESGASASVTKEIQKEDFIDLDNNINYAVIDTVGIGDTQLKREEVLDKLAEAVYLAREGIQQILFVTNGRFDQFEMATFNLLRAIIFDANATNHTTIVRTKFDEFYDEEACQLDIKKMLKEGDNLCDIVNSCQERIIHVNNPTLAKKTGEELEANKGDREDSREKMLNHLKAIHHNEPYKPEKLQSLSDEIFDYMEEKIKKREELAKREAEKKRKFERSENKEKNKDNNNKETTSLIGSDLVEEIKSIIEEKNQKEGKEVLIKSEISNLENKLKKLQEIKGLIEGVQKAEGQIRHAVFNHVFNNIENIKEVTGGDIFLNSITSDENNLLTNKLTFAELIAKRKELETKLLEKKNNKSLEEIEKEIEIKEQELLNLKKELLTIKEIFEKWQIQGFTIEQTQSWAEALKNSFNSEHDVYFCVWLRDDKKLVPSVLSTYNLESLRTEYHNWLVDYTQGLNEINEQADISKEGSAQEFLTQKYPNNQIRELDLSNQSLEESLIIQDYPNLEIIKCGNNKDLITVNLIDLPKLNFFHANGCQLTSLTVEDCPNITDFNVANNLLVDTTFLTNLNPEKLTRLSIHSNNFSEQDLTCFSKFVNLERLFIDNNDKNKFEQGKYNRFTGSLEPLKGLPNLKYLNIANTDINSGLEFLSSNFKKICLINSWERENAGYLDIKWEFEAAIESSKSIKGLMERGRDEPPFASNWYRLAFLKETKKHKENNAQEWFDKNYPLHTNRHYYKELNISDLNLVGKLDLSNFTGLEKLDCSNNLLTELDLSKCQNLIELNCSNNKFTNIDFLKQISNKDKLEKLNLSNNQEFQENLKFLIPFTNLKELNVSNCSFEDSLEPLTNLNLLSLLFISNTNIDNDLEYLPNNLERIYCNNTQLIEILDPYQGNIQQWKEAQPAFQKLKKSWEKFHPDQNIWDFLKKENVFFNVRTGSFQGNSVSLISFLQKDQIINEKEAEIKQLKKLIEQPKELIIQQREKIAEKINKCIEQNPNKKENLTKLVKIYTELEKAKLNKVEEVEIIDKLEEDYEKIEQELKKDGSLERKFLWEIKQECNELINLEQQLEEKEKIIFQLREEMLVNSMVLEK